MIKQLQCSVFDTYARIIAHQVNCMGVMGSGVAAQVKNKFPVAYDMYREYCQCNDLSIDLLGKTQFCAVKWLPDGQPQVYIANLFAQFGYGRKKDVVYTNYAALKKYLRQLAAFANEHHYTIALPYRMGCGLGGGNWEGRVYPMIERELAGCDVLICHK